MATLVSASASCRVRVRVEEQLHGGNARLLSKSNLKLKLKSDKTFTGLSTLLKAGAQDIPAEIRDDPKFVPLNEEDPSYGPAAMLLVGFEKQEISKIEEYLNNMDAEFVKMLKQTLWRCMHTKEQDVKRLELVAGLPRICFMSGMTGEEIMTIVQTFPEIGLEDNAFAALVPKNAQNLVEEVIDEVIGDHERLTKQSNST